MIIFGASKAAEVISNINYKMDKVEMKKVGHQTRNKWNKGYLRETKCELNVNLIMNVMIGLCFWIIVVYTLV